MCEANTQVAGDEIVIDSIEYVELWESWDDKDNYIPQEAVEEADDVKMEWQLISWEGDIGEWEA